MVQLDVMAAAQPSDVQRLVIPVVMGINRVAAAHLAALLVQRSRQERPLNREMGRVLGQIGAAPVGLAGLAFQQRQAGGL